MLRLLIFPLFIALLLSCGQSDDKKKDTEISEKSKPKIQEPVKGEKDILATVNDAPIYRGMLVYNTADPLRQAIIDEVMFQNAVKTGLVKKRDFDKELSGKEQIRIDRAKAAYKFRAVELMRREVLMNVNVNQKITDKEIKDYYNSNIDKYTYLKTVQFTFTSSPEVAQEVYNMLTKGNSITEVRNEFKEQDLKIAVKENGLSNNQDLVGKFKEKEDGKISKPVKVNGKYTIYKIVQVKKIPIERLYPTIKSNIGSTRKQVAIEQYVDNLINNGDYNVVITEGEKTT